jgi:hypothetical protein
MNIKQPIAVGAIVIAGALTAGSASARPLEGGGVELATCSPLKRLVVDATVGHPVRKAHAIIGLSGPNAAVDLERIQQAVAKTCS